MPEKLQKEVESWGSDKPKLSKVQLEVLLYLTRDFLTPLQISIRRKKSISSVYKIIDKLKEKGVYSSNTKKLHNIDSTFTPFINGIRLHGQEYNIQILYKDKRYLDLLNAGNIIEYDGNTIRLYKDSIEVYGGHSFYGEDVQSATSKSMYYWNHFIVKLENKLHLILHKPLVNNIKLVNSHYADINNGIARECKVTGDKIRIFTRDDGKLWFLIDNSFNLHEAETVHPDSSKFDMEKVKAYFNDIRDNKINLPSETKEAILGMTYIINELAISQLNASRQIELLLSLLVPKAQKPTDTSFKPDYFG